MATASLLAVSQKRHWSRTRNIALWILQTLAAAAFLMAGGSKLSGAEQMVAMFDVIGLGQWFRYFTGSVEAAGALLLLIPRTAAIGAAILGVTMVGAIMTHLLVIGGSPLPAIVLFLMVSSVAWYRRPVGLARH